MKNFARVARISSANVLLILLLTALALHAQPASGPSAGTAESQEELMRAELRTSYQQARDQLQAALQAMTANRAETEAFVRAQSLLGTEKLEALRTSIQSERAAWQIERERLQSEMRAERDRQQAEVQHTNRFILWVAGGFGAVGLLAMILNPILQWRAANRLGQILSLQPTGPVAPPVGFPPDHESPSDLAVATSNRRLMSVIDRMEQRIFELEHTARPLPADPLPSPAAPPRANLANGNGTELPSPRREAPLQPNPIVTVAMGKAKFLLVTNSLKEAIASYDAVLKVEPQNTDALIEKGSALERLHQDQEAIRCYDRAIALNPELTLALLAKGGVCARLGLHEDALACYERAMKVEEKRK